MACFHPMHGYRGKDGRWTSNINLSPTRVKMVIPCRQCIGCRLEHSRQWAVRCMHEASLWESNVFITLTYSPEFLPADGSLDHRHFVLFMKRLRDHFGAGIRFYMCGEYGEALGRPHYHAILFNCDFIDKRIHTIRNKLPVYTSAKLAKLWPYGLHEIGSVTFQSAGYVARYVMKKVTGDAALDHYTRVDMSTGEIFVRKPEYTQMSRRSGIGKGWFDKFKGDVFPNDFVLMNGKRMRPPRYYDYHFELGSPSEMRLIKHLRRKASRKHVDNNTPERLSVREACTLAKASRLVRPLDGA